MRDMKVKVEAKKDALAATSKLSDRKLTEFDDETDGIINNLHQTRDEQIKAIRCKYDELEAKIVRLRRELRTKIQDFKEMMVDEQRSELITRVQMAEVGLRQGHQVEVVRGFRQTESLIKYLLKGGLPSLTLTDAVTLASNGKHRDLELKIVPAKQILISSIIHRASKKGRSSVDPPTLMQQVQTVDFNRFSVDFKCQSIAHYQGDTYVGLSNGSIVRLDQFHRQHVVIECVRFVGSIPGLAVHNDRLYALLKSTRGARQYLVCVQVYDLNGKLITSWQHPHSDTAVNLTVVDNQLVIPDGANNELIVYSLDGQVVKHILYSSPRVKSRLKPNRHCAGFGLNSHQNFVNSGSAANPNHRGGKYGRNLNSLSRSLSMPIDRGFSDICSVGEDSVIVSDSSTSEISRVNISTGELMWTFNYEVGQRGAVVCYKEKYVLLAADYSKQLRVRILDVNSGVVLNTLHSNWAMHPIYPTPTVNPANLGLFSITLAGDMLIVTKPEESTFYCYTLK